MFKLLKMKNNKKRSHNEMINSNKIINKEKGNKIKTLCLPKLQYYIFLETNLIDKREAKKVNLSNNPEILYQNIENNTINIYITKLLHFNINIPSNYFIITEITKDGNCFFRAVSKYLAGIEKYNLYLRKITYN